MQDTWTDEESYLNLDDRNDCTFMRLKRRRNEVRLVFQRKFDTCDPQDYVIEVSTGCVPFFRPTCYEMLMVKWTRHTHV